MAGPATLFVTLFLLHGAPSAKPMEMALQFKSMTECEEYFQTEGRIRHQQLMQRGAAKGVTLMAKGGCREGLLRDIRPGYPQEWIDGILDAGEAFL